jgi:hypothetical protein
MNSKHATPEDFSRWTDAAADLLPLLAAIDRAAVLRWFGAGRASQNAAHALDMIAKSAAAGYWLPKVSRPAHAALNKQAAAIKIGRQYRDWKSPEYKIVGEMMYGSYGAVDRTIADIKEHGAAADAEVVRQAREWVAAMAPLAALIKALDARRPAPVVVLGTLSRTVLDNLGRSLQVELDSVASPERRLVWVKVPDPRNPGQTIEVAEIEILWPEGTRHSTSRFAHGTAHNDQCHACGHAIRNGFNWVPLVATTPRGPVSLWVGRDCAKKLFGCDVTGEAVYTERAASGLVK